MNAHILTYKRQINIYEEINILRLFLPEINPKQIPYTFVFLQRVEVIPLVRHKKISVLIGCHP